jgi:hypothetical protein
MILSFIARAGDVCVQLAIAPGYRVVTPNQGPLINTINFQKVKIFSENTLLQESRLISVIYSPFYCCQYLFPVIRLVARIERIKILFMC